MTGYVAHKRQRALDHGLVMDVCRVCGVSQVMLLGRSRRPEVVKARHVLWAVLVRRGFTYVRSARLTGFDHTSVIHGVKLAEKAYTYEIDIIEPRSEPEAEVPLPSTAKELPRLGRKALHLGKRCLLDSEKPDPHGMVWIRISGDTWRVPFGEVTRL